MEKNGDREGIEDFIGEEEAELGGCLRWHGEDFELVVGDG